MDLVISRSEKYSVIRQKLDHNGFKHSLSFDSCNLVDALLKEITALKAKLSKASVEQNVPARKNTQLDVHYQAYKNDNAKLQKENNTLNINLLRSQENFDSEILAMKSKIRALELQNANLNFLAGQYQDKVDVLEQNIENRSTPPVLESKLAQLPKKGLKLQNKYKNSKTNYLYDVRDRNSNQSSDPYIADLLRIADNKINELESSNTSLATTVEEKEASMRRLENKVMYREAEITRLQDLLQSGRPADVVVEDYLKNIYEDKVNHLESQVEYLQEQLFSNVKSSTHASTTQKPKIGAPQKSNSVKYDTTSNKMEKIIKEKENLESLVSSLEKSDNESRDIILQLLSNEKELMMEIERLNEILRFTCLDSPPSDGSNQSLLDELSRKVKELSKEKGIFEKKYIELQNKTEEVVLAKCGNCEKVTNELEKLKDAKDRHLQEIDSYKQSMEDKIKLLSSEKSTLSSEHQKVSGEVEILKSKIVGLQNNSSLGKNNSALESINDLLDRIQDKDKLITELMADKKSNFSLQQVNETEKLEHKLLQHKNLIKSLEKQLKEYEMKLHAFKILNESRMTPEVHRKDHPQVGEVLSGEFWHNETDLQRIEELKNENEILLKKMQICKEKISSLSNSISKIDEEKDAIQSQLDSKTENYVDLQNNLNKKEKEVAFLKMSFSTLETENDQASKDIIAKGRSLNSLRKTITNVQEELAYFKDVSAGLETANKQLKSDLNSITNEHVVVSRELSQSRQQQEQLKSQLREFVIEIKRTEEIISAKNKDQNDLLEQYNSLSSETSFLKRKVDEQQAENNSVKMELFTDDSENRFLVDTIYRLERELEYKENVNNQCDTEICQLSYSLNAAEDNLELSQADVEKHMSELQMERELTRELKFVKTELMSKLAIVTSKIDSSNLECEEKQRTIEVLQSEVESNDGTISTLEELLSSKRTQEYGTEIATENLSKQIQLMQQKLSEAENTIKEQTTNLLAYKKKVVDLEEETEKLKRQLLNEKFERERAIQEVMQLRNNRKSYSPRRSQNESNIDSICTSVEKNFQNSDRNSNHNNENSAVVYTNKISANGLKRSPSRDSNSSSTEKLGTASNAIEEIKVAKNR